MTLSCRVRNDGPAPQECCVEQLLITAVVHERVVDVGRMEVGVHQAMTGDKMDLLLESRLLAELTVEDCIVQNAAAMLTQNLVCADEDAHSSVLEDVDDLLFAALN